jgi:DNA topoisomerase-1
MEKNFTNLMDYEFTAKLEDDLDAIARGEAENISYLRKFYFGNGHPGLQAMVENGEKTIDPREVNGLPLGQSEDGRTVEIRIGRFGPFITDGENRASVPDSIAPDELNLSVAIKVLEDAKKGPQSLGEIDGKPAYLKKGRFGPYLQLGDMVEGEEKPKMSSLLPNQKPDEVTFEIAKKLLELPKSLGNHPELGEEIILSNGRYGPYVKCGKDNRTIPMEEFPPLALTLEQAIDLFSRQKTRGGRTVQQSKIIKELGVDNQSKKKIVIKSGKYGDYVTDGETNATLPEGVDIEQFTIVEALALIESRAAAGGRKKKGGAKKAAAPKEAKPVKEKKEVVKKAPAKKKAKKADTE